MFSDEHAIARVGPLDDSVRGVKEHLASRPNPPRRQWAASVQGSDFVHSLSQLIPLLSIAKVRHDGPIGARLLGE